MPVVYTCIFKYLFLCFVEVYALLSLFLLCYPSSARSTIMYS